MEYDRHRLSSEEQQTEASEAAESSESFFNSELGEQAQQWLDTRIGELKEAWEAGGEFDEGVKQQLVEIFKAGAGFGVVEASITEGEEPDPSWWDIITGTDGYLAGVPGVAAAWKRGGHKGDLAVKKLDKIFGFDNAWENVRLVKQAKKEGRKYVAPGYGNQATSEGAA